MRSSAARRWWESLCAVSIACLLFCSATARGFEVAKGQYLLVEDQEIDAVQIESTRTIEIDQFVPRSEIDDRYIDSPYYSLPTARLGRTPSRSFATR